MQLHRTKSQDTFGNKPFTNADYEKFKTSVISGDVFKQTVKLSDVTIDSPTAITIQGKTVPMTQSAFMRLCRLLGLDERANRNLMDSLGELPTAKLMDLVRQAQIARKKNEISVTFCKSEASVTNFSSNTTTLLPGAMFIESLETIMNRNSTLQIVGAQHEANGNILVVARNPKWAFNVTGIDNESFHAGMTYSLDDSGVTIEQYLERLICMNGMSLRGADDRIKCTSEGKIGPFLRAAATFSGFNTTQFQGRVDAFMKVPASVREVKTAVNTLRDTLGTGAGTKDLIQEHIPYMELRRDAEKKLGLHNVFRMPSEFQAKMNSNMNYWDLVNAVTYIASHEVGDMNTRHKLMTYAGDMMIANPDIYMPISQIYTSTTTGIA